MLQLARNLGGNQWIQYDKIYREWAVAKKMSMRGIESVNHCLASQHKLLPQPLVERMLRSGKGKKRRAPAITDPIHVRNITECF